MTELRLDWCSHKAAEYACKSWHYSKTLPVPPLVKVGVWENKRYIGCILFSRGASPDLMKPYGLTQTQGCELTRVALTSHDSPVSRIMAQAIRMMKRENPKLRLIVSFADQSKGHHGGIYQATNWIYAGMSAPSVEYWKDGKRWHTRQLSEKGYTIQFGAKRVVPKPSDCEKIKVPGKHRYLMPLDAEMKDRILPLAKPYPKRVKQANEGVQPSSGGAAPTHTLQKTTEVICA